MDPFFEVFNILDNEKHKEHKNVISDIDSLDPNELAEFVNEFYINEMIGRQEDKEIAKRARFLIHLLQREIN